MFTAGGGGARAVWGGGVEHLTYNSLRPGNTLLNLTAIIENGLNLWKLET